VPCANGWQIKIVFGGLASTQRPYSHFLSCAMTGVQIRGLNAVDASLRR
jgi:hypothetical protein